MLHTKEKLTKAVSEVVNRSAFFSTVYGNCWRYWFHLADNRITNNVSDITAEFDVSTRSEYVRAKQLGGEKPILATLLDELDGDEIVWDIGACVGTYSCFIANALTSGRVIAFEPNPRNRTRLMENLQLTNDAHRWDISPVALYNDTSEKYLVSEFVEVGSGHHYLTAKSDVDNIDSENKILIETQKADDLINQGYPAPDVIKIDVQGAEMPVLKGMKQTLAKTDTIFIEIHTEKCRRYNSSVADIKSLLQELGYELTKLAEPTTRRTGVCYICARRPESK
jgi:FkbM family methyltransferase